MKDERDERRPPVEIVDLDPQVVPDNTGEETYAIYLRLSYDPPLEWQRHFEKLMLQEVRQRTVTVVPGRLRVVVSRRDNLDMVLKQMQSLARRTNIELDYTG